MHTTTTVNNSLSDALSPDSDRDVHLAKTCVDLVIAVLTWSALPAVAFVAISLSRGSFSTTQLCAAVLFAVARASIDYVSMNPAEMDAVHQAHCMDVASGLAQPEGLPGIPAPTRVSCAGLGK